MNFIIVDLEKRLKKVIPLQKDSKRTKAAKAVVSFCSQKQIQEATARLHRYQQDLVRSLTIVLTVTQAIDGTITVRRDPFCSLNLHWYLDICLSKVERTFCKK